MGKVESYRKLDGTVVRGHFRDGGRAASMSRHPSSFGGMPDVDPLDAAGGVQHYDTSVEGRARRFHDVLMERTGSRRVALLGAQASQVGDDPLDVGEFVEWRLRDMKETDVQDVADSVGVPYGAGSAKDEPVVAGVASKFSDWFEESQSGQ